MSKTPTDQNVYSAVAGFAATPDDSAVFADASRAVFVGGSGDLTVRMLRDGSTLTFASVSAGTLLPISVDMVLATGTTATSVLVLR